MDKHLKELIVRYPELDGCAQDIERAFQAIRDCYQKGGKVLLCGNGGSAADCEHWTGELMKGFEIKKTLDPDLEKRLPPQLAQGLHGALPAIPLTGFLSLSTAFANDVDPYLIFAQLVVGLGRKEDVLIGISTSGNSRSVCHAIEVAKAKDMVTIGLTGGNGGRLKMLVDICIKAPAGETYKIQELHVPIYHCISLMLENEFYG